MPEDSSNERIIDYYRDGDETSRLRIGWFQLEHERTRELITRHLPTPPASIIDAGGGAGVYACWLASLGYEVHLIDPVAKHIEQARAASRQQSGHPLASAEIGDARRLMREDNSADAILLLGPLYHLVEKEDRLACLREARRVVRPGGLVWGAAISRFASLFDSLATGFFADPAFAPILERDLREGQHRNPTPNPLYFTDAYLHVPANCRASSWPRVFRFWRSRRSKVRHGSRGILNACGMIRCSANGCWQPCEKSSASRPFSAPAHTSWRSGASRA